MLFYFPISVQPYFPANQLSKMKEKAKPTQIVNWVFLFSLCRMDRCNHEPNTLQPASDNTICIYRKYFSIRMLLTRTHNQAFSLLKHPSINESIWSYFFYVSYSYDVLPSSYEFSFFFFCCFICCCCCGYSFLFWPEICNK